MTEIPPPDYIPSIITGIVAIVAGVGSASLTSWFNRKNTKDTLKAAREADETRWQLQVDREHEVWLRDAKQQAYSRYIAAVSELVAGAAPAEQRDAHMREVAIALSAVRLVSPPKIRDVAVALHIQLKDLMKWIGEQSLMYDDYSANEESIKEFRVKIDHAVDWIGDLIGAFVTLARNDTGAEKDEEPALQPG